MKEPVVLNTGLVDIVVTDPPEYGYDFEIRYLDCPRLIWRKGNGENIPLPPGRYSILGFPKDVTEKQAKEIMKGDKESPYPFSSWRGYFESFLTANNIEKEFLLIKEKIDYGKAEKYFKTSK